MKICPKCFNRYSDMWKLCTVCKSPLKRLGFLEKIFTRPYSVSRPSFSLIEKIIDQAGAVFLYLDKKLRPVICNKAIEEITGHGREEIFKGDWLDFLFSNSPSRKEMLRASIKNCLTSTESRTYECALTKKDGSECILSWKSTAVTNPSGNIIGIVCIVSDITEMKSFEENVVMQSERLKNIFASIQDYALITTNLEGKITYYEKTTAVLFGWKDNMTLRDISVIFPEQDRNGAMSRIRDTLLKDGKFEEEVKLLGPDKELFPAIVTMSCLFNKEGIRVGYVYIARDITKRKILEEKMIQAGKLIAIGQLAAGVAHEINNPLLVILGRLDMLSMDDEKFTPNVKHTIETIKGQAERMRIIVDRLLSYSRKKTPRMDIVNVNEILKTISPLLAYHPAFRKISWEEELAEDLPKIRGDFNQLQEMFLNIGLNACQAMPEGGTITISSKDKKDGFVEVTVRDTGVGMKEEDLRALFTPFFTTKDSGSGLGLAICQGIAASHNGKIEAESRLGEGSAFRISLPLITEQEDGRKIKYFSS